MKTSKRISFQKLDRISLKKKSKKRSRHHQLTNQQKTKYLEKKFEDTECMHAYQHTSEDQYAVTRMEIRRYNFTKLVQSL